MQIILQKAVIDSVKIKNLMNRITVDNLNNLTEPCFYPDWKKYYFQILNLMQLTDQDIKQFTKRFYVETEIQSNYAQYGKIPKLLQDPGSNILIILLHHFMKQKDSKTFSTIMIYYMIRQYGNFLRETLKYCKPEVFSYTLNHLNPSHLYIREKTISNAIYHLSQAMIKRHSDGFIDGNPTKISNFIYEARSRIAQSQRSFNEAYYKYEKEGKSIKNPDETDQGVEIQPEQLEKGVRIADLVSKKICIYKELNIKIMEDARKLTKINTSLATSISKNLGDVEFTEEVRFIIELFLKDAKNLNDICGKNFIPYVKSLMSLKRTIKKVYYKQEINNLLLKILAKIGYKAKYEKLTSQTQFQINSFLSFYITMYVRSIIC